MAADMSKGKSPFYPGQPVPVELFVGRAKQIDRIMNRAVAQVSAGKPIAVFVQGEYGIGKSSIAGFVQWIAEKHQALHGIYAPLGGARERSDVAVTVLEATLRSGAFDPKRSEKVRNWLAKYIGRQELFGFTLNAEALRKDAPSLATPFGMLGFLTETVERLKDDGIKGIFLVLDEINGITENPQFANFIKGLVDTNAMSSKPLPLLLMLCGVEERRRQMIQKHQPVDRIFDVIEIESMDVKEMEAFFQRAFDSVSMPVEPSAMSILTQYSAGFPKIMHLVGDAAFWIDRDGIIKQADALTAVFLAAEEVGKKYVDQQVYRALRSPDYKSILAKIGKMDPDTMSFKKADVASGLTESEKKKFNNFLQEMKSLNVLRSGDVPGEYIFNVRMVRLYIWLQSLEEKNRQAGK
ncbi:MAG: hypothetical protein DMG09_16590 [Acidobacteria bacterium]|nr:MAG: hypothetical protein DMG09_16590 [Acidobacteriota bacterium]